MAELTVTQAKQVVKNLEDELAKRRAAAGDLAPLLEQTSDYQRIQENINVLKEKIQTFSKQEVTKGLRAELDVLDKKIREQQAIQIKSARESGSAAAKRLEAAGAEEARLRALSKEKFAELAAANKENRLDFLKAERERLLAEEEALAKEYSLGPNNTFLTGAKLEAWEARVRQNAKDLSQNFKSIQAESGQDSAKGQTAQAPFNANFAPDNPGTGKPDTTQNLNQPLSTDQKNNLVKGAAGQRAVNQAQDPTAANKQILSQTNGAANKSEANFSEADATNLSGSVAGQNVTGKKSDYENVFLGGSGVSTYSNRLHAYSSYTYRISLFLLTRQDYNVLSTNPKKFIPTFSLISSGAGFAAPGVITTTYERKSSPWGGFEDVPSTQTKAGRHPDFQTDFFIDNLQLTTVVGLNAQTKSSNAIEISFNITEPYGLSLLDRLLSACETSGDRNTNYIAQPYLLQIDFLASATDETLLAGNKTNNVIDTKRIAIKIQEMKIKPTGSGTTYAVRAIPFNHTAFSATTAALPVNIKVEAGTVGEFFSNSEDYQILFSREFKSQEERLENELKAWFADQDNGMTQPTPEQLEAKRTALKNAIIYNSKSYAAGYNSYMEKIVKDQQLSKFPPTKIAFAVDSTFINSPIVANETSQGTNTRMIDPRTTVGQTDPGYKTVESFNIREGTNVIEVIDQVMSKSQYIKSQIKTLLKDQANQEAKNQYNNGNQRAKDNTPPQKLNWYRVVPTVALNNFDASRNDYSKTILYNILPYKAVNSYHPNFPKTTAESVASKIVREYFYVYTGKNQDILRLDIDFDSTYYTQLTTYRNQVARLGTNALSDPKDYPATQFGFQANSQQNLLPNTIQYVGSNKESNGMNTATNPEEKIIADLRKSIYTSQRGDLLNIKMQIIGDPDFIKQDDIYYNPGTPSEYLEFSKSRTNFADVPINASGQILFDNEQVFVKIYFQNAVDINDNKGIVNKQELLQNGRLTNGTFTGVYKVQKVTSDFSRGQFTQTLDLIRMPDVLPETPVPAGQTTQTGTAATTESAKASEESDNSKRADISRNPAGVAPTPQPRLVDAANQPAVSDPTINSGAGNPQARPNTYQSAPQNANNAQNIAPQNKAGWTFSDAFRQARKDFGNKPGGYFEYRGKLYQTNYQNEPFVANPKPVYPGANE